jgi:hypothetical protein
VKCRLGREISLVVYFGLLAAPLSALSLSASIAAPLETDGFSALLAEEGAAIGDLGRVQNLDLWFPEEGPGPFSLSFFQSASSPLWIGGAVLGVPSFDVGLSIPGFSLPMLAAGARFAGYPWSASIALANVFAPQLETEVQPVVLSLQAEPAICVAGQLGYADLSLRALWAEGEGSFRLDYGTSEATVGAYSGMIAFLSLGWRDLGAMCGFSTGDASLDVRNVLGTILDIPWFEGEGSFDLRFALAWGRLHFEWPRLTLGLEGGGGLLWNLGSSLSATMGSGATVSSVQAWSLDSPSSGIVIAHPYLVWEATREIRLRVGKWLPFYWGWNVTGPSSATSGNQVSASSLGTMSVRTLLLSGLELVCIYGDN